MPIPGNGRFVIRYGAEQGEYFGAMRLCHPPDGSTSPEYKLLCFITSKKFFCKEKNALAFNRDRCCHLVICLQLIPFHWVFLLTASQLTNSPAALTFNRVTDKKSSSILIY
jgi:hypothetical protein